MGSSSPFLSAMSNRCVSLAILLLCLMLAANAERDFNVNDSQVSGKGGDRCAHWGATAALSFVC